jgi:nucleoside-triphosphatase THEP1
LHERYYPENETIYIEDDENAYLYKIGPYHVVKQSMTMISNTYRELILSEINPIYFDEVGVLELRKQGYYDSICLALANKKDIVITIRDDLILKFLDLFKITEYRIISG